MGGGCCGRPSPPFVARPSRSGGRGATSALAGWFVSLPSPRGRACQPGGREEGRRVLQRGGLARPPAPAHLPPLLVRCGPGGRRGSGPVEAVAALPPAGPRCRRGGGHGRCVPPPPPAVWLGSAARGREDAEGLPPPLPFPHLYFPFPRRLARAGRLLRSTGSALPTGGLCAAAPAPERGRPWPSPPFHPAGSGRRWDIGDLGDERGVGMRSAVLLPIRRRSLGKCKVEE